MRLHSILLAKFPIWPYQIFSMHNNYSYSFALLPRPFKLRTQYSVLLFLLLVAQIVVGVLVFTNKHEVQRFVDRIVNQLWRDRQSNRKFWDVVQQLVSLMSSQKCITAVMDMNVIVRGTRFSVFSSNSPLVPLLWIECGYRLESKYTKIMLRTRR